MNKKIELSPRLQMVADLIPEGVRLADVGTDHAYLPAALLMSRKISRAIAADLREGPLSRAKLTAQEYHLGNAITFCLCNGLQGIEPGAVDAVSIAGMGGETITEILKAAPWLRTHHTVLVLQPQSTMPELRSWLAGNGYQIVTERLCREGDTLYTAFLVQAGEMRPLSPAELWAGENRPDPLRGLWLDKLIHKTDVALEGLAKAVNEQAAERKASLEEIRSGLIQMKKEWEAWQ